MNEDMMQFERAIDHACKSKFIMIDKRVSDILKSIAGSNDVFESIKSCMVGFDFGRELRISTTVEGHFAMPSDPKRVVALAFCLLSAIDDKKIDVGQLLGKSFVSDDPYAKFCDEVLVPFKNYVMSMVQDGEVSNQKQETNKLSVALQDRAIYLAGQLEPFVKSGAKDYVECFVKSTKMGEKQFMIVFFDLLLKNLKRGGKKLAEELGTVMKVVKEQ